MQPEQVWETVLQTSVAQSSLTMHWTHLLTSLSQCDFGSTQSPSTRHSGFAGAAAPSPASALRAALPEPPRSDMVFPVPQAVATVHVMMATTAVGLIGECRRAAPSLRPRAVWLRRDPFRPDAPPSSGEPRALLWE